MWRKLTQADVDSMVEPCEYGIAARYPSLSDTPYNGVTIIGSEKLGSELNLRLARPMAYSSKYTNNRQPYLYAEVFSMSAKRAMEELEVWDSPKLGILQFRT